MLSQRSSTSLMRSSTVNCSNFVSMIRASLFGTRIGYAAAVRMPRRNSARILEFGMRCSRLLTRLENRNHLGAVLQPVQVILPGPYHFAALLQMRRPVVSASIRIAHRMRKLMLDEIRSEA